MLLTQTRAIIHTPAEKTGKTAYWAVTTLAMQLAVVMTMTSRKTFEQ